MKIHLLLLILMIPLVTALDIEGPNHKIVNSQFGEVYVAINNTNTSVYAYSTDQLLFNQSNVSSACHGFFCFGRPIPSISTIYGGGGGGLPPIEIIEDIFEDEKPKFCIFTFLLFILYIVIRYKRRRIEKQKKVQQ